MSGASAISFVSSHPVLEDFAVDLAKSLGTWDGPAAEVHVGAHRVRRLEPAAVARIGLQTEQLLDDHAAPLWKAFSQDRIERIVTRFDAVLDLSPANRPAYAFLPAPLRAKVSFGPHIFPQTPPAFHAGGSRLLFVGAPSARRTAALAGLTPPATVAPEGTFGAALGALIDRSAGLANIHFHPGVYTEYPRLLKAVLHGKAVFSDPLAAPLRMGEHYLPLTADPGAPERAAVYNRMANLLCGTFAFAPFLKDLLGTRAKEPA